MAQPVVLFAIGSLVGGCFLLPCILLDDLTALSWSALTPMCVNAAYATGAAVGAFKSLAIVGPINQGVLGILCRVFVVMWSCVSYGTTLNVVQRTGLVATMVGAVMFSAANSSATAQVLQCKTEWGYVCVPAERCPCLRRVLLSQLWD